MSTPRDDAALFPSDYESSRARFHSNLNRIRSMWQTAKLSSYSIDADSTIDWVTADALERKDKLLILTGGEHGVEGYVGAAMLQLFVDEFLVRLDTRTTGVLFVHAINPWGMRHRRRTNAGNVDLNRNFVASDESFSEFANPSYERLLSLLNPQSPIRSWMGSNLAFAVRVIWSLRRLGASQIRAAMVLGQYRFPQGIYFGGDSIQPETKRLMELYRHHLNGYAHVVLLDMHTGYGLRDQMAIVNSVLDTRESQECQRQYNYPLVVKSNPAEFYSMQGDMIDWFHAFARKDFPQVQFYAAALEFGTFGDSTLALMRSLRALVLENQMHWFGGSESARQRVVSEFREMFAPENAAWRAKAVADARQAFDGILGAEGFLV